MRRIAFIAALALAGSGAYAAVRIEAKGINRYDIYAGIRPDVVLCVDHICDRLSPSQARHIASALTIAAQEQEDKK